MTGDALDMRRDALIPALPYERTIDNTFLACFDRLINERDFNNTLMSRMSQPRSLERDVSSSSTSSIWKFVGDTQYTTPS